MDDKSIFPPATARVLHVTCKDFSDDLSEVRPFYLYRGDLVSSPEIRFDTKFADPNLEIEQLVFRRITLRCNGRSYPFYIDKDNFDFVVPIINGMIEEGVRKGKEEYEWKLKQRENELDDRLKWWESRKQIHAEQEKALADYQFQFAELYKTWPFKVDQVIKRIKSKIKNIWYILKNLSKYRIRIEQKDIEE